MKICSLQTRRLSIELWCVGICMFQWVCLHACLRQIAVRFEQILQNESVWFMFKALKNQLSCVCVCDLLKIVQSPIEIDPL